MKLGPPKPVKAKISDVTALRAWATVYHNTSGRPLLVIFYSQLIRVAADDGVVLEGYVESVTPPTVIVASCGLLALGPATQERFALVFMVPNGHYYKIERALTGTGTSTFESWFEVEL